MIVLTMMGPIVSTNHKSRDMDGHRNFTRPCRFHFHPTHHCWVSPPCCPPPPHRTSIPLPSVCTEVCVQPRFICTYTAVNYENMDSSVMKNCGYLAANQGTDIIIQSVPIKLDQQPSTVWKQNLCSCEFAVKVKLELQSCGSPAQFCCMPADVPRNLFPFHGNPAPLASIARDSW